MLFTSRLLTSLVFAAHGLLGCGVHHICQHGAALSLCCAPQHEEHACASHSHSHHDGDEADHEDHAPSDPCKHSVCNYVKCETQRIELLTDLPADFALATSIDRADGAGQTSARFEPVRRADLSPTHIYVWHCALII